MISRRAYHLVLIVSVALAALYIAHLNHRRALELRLSESISRYDIVMVRKILQEHPGLVNRSIGSTPGGIDPRPLHCAMEVFVTDDSSIAPRRLEMVKLLLELGADVHYVDGHGYNYLYFAASLPDPALTRFLLLKGVAPYTGREYANERPVIKLAELCNRAVLAEYAHIEARGIPDIHYYTAVADVQAVRALIQKDKSLIQMRDVTGRRAFDYANSCGDATLKSILSTGNDN